MGVVRDTVPIPPKWEPNDKEDGRRHQFRDTSVDDGDDVEATGNVVKVQYEGKHGHPPVTLWYPEAALEEIAPPQEMQRLLREAEAASEQLKAKQQLLRQRRHSFKL